jgi:hypothetical protein
MNILVSSLFIFLAASLNVQAGTDPVKDYLSTFSPDGGDNKFYSDDRLLRLDLDLNNDGRKEVLLSMARNRNGKMGNVWTVYSEIQNGYVEVGGMAFSASGFYLGKIDELGQYGLVNFWPSGAGEGTIYGYVFDGRQITDRRIGEVIMDRQAHTYKGKEILAKYAGENAIVGDSVITTISADELAAKYGIKIEPETYAQSMRERASMTRSTTASADPLSTATPSNHVAESTPAPVEQPTPLTSPTLSGETKRPTSSLPIILITMIAVLIVGAVAFLLVRKRP